MGAAQVSRDNVSDALPCSVPGWKGSIQLLAREKTLQRNPLHQCDSSFLPLWYHQHGNLGWPRKKWLQGDKVKISEIPPTPFPLWKPMFLGNMVNFSIKEGNWLSNQNNSLQLTHKRATVHSICAVNACNKTLHGMQMAFGKLLGRTALSKILGELPLQNPLWWHSDRQRGQWEEPTTTPVPHHSWWFAF